MRRRGTLAAIGCPSLAVVTFVAMILGMYWVMFDPFGGPDPHPEDTICGRTSLGSGPNSGTPALAEADSQHTWAVNGKSVHRWRGDGWQEFPELPETVDTALAGSSGPRDLWVADHSGGTVYQYRAEKWREFDLSDKLEWTHRDATPGRTDERRRERLRIVAVEAVSPDDVWLLAAGTTDTAYALHYDGNEWTRMSVPAVEGASMVSEDEIVPGELALSAASSTDVFAVHSAENDTTGARWTGEEWEAVGANLPRGLTDDSRDGLVDVHARSPEDVWAVGWKWGGSGSVLEPAVNPEPLLAHWDGESWSVQSENGPGGYSRVTGDGLGGLIIAKWEDSTMRETGRESVIARRDSEGTITERPLNADIRVLTDLAQLRAGAVAVAGIAPDGHGAVWNCDLGAFF